MKLAKKIHYSFHSLKRLQNFRPHNTKFLLSQSLLLPLLDYADVCYLDITDEQMMKFERLKNLCMRYIYSVRKYDHVPHFLPIRRNAHIFVLTLLYNTINKSSPPYLR